MSEPTPDREPGRKLWQPDANGIYRWRWWDDLWRWLTKGRSDA